VGEIHEIISERQANVTAQSVPMIASSVASYTPHSAPYRRKNSRIMADAATDSLRHPGHGTQLRKTDRPNKKT
jgi:hypothetical protein